MYKPNRKMIYVYRIYEFIFSIIILFYYYCFSGTPPMNVTPVHDPVEDLHTNTFPVWAEVSSLTVTRSTSWKRTQSNWKSEKNLWRTFATCPTHLQYLKYSYIFFFFFYSFVSFTSFLIFEISTYTGSLVIYPLSPLTLIIFLSFVPP